MCVCVCVCVCETHREREYVCVRNLRNPINLYPLDHHLI